MKVLADLHHGDLYESLRILFEDRLGWKLYRPIGIEWHTEDYWAVYNHPATAAQYLQLEEPLDVHGNNAIKVFGEQAWINKEVSLSSEPGVHFVLAPVHGGRLYRAIELAAAKEAEFDLVISSMPAHFERYERFRKQYCPQAHHIFQMGNINWQLPDGVQNVLNSTTIPTAGVHAVQYHQEFSLGEFCYRPCPNPTSLANLMHFQRGHYEHKFAEVGSLLRQSGWSVKNYGAGNADGPVHNVAETIRRTGFIWHCKKGGDGYGYNIHNAFACGRPMVVSLRDYHGLMASPLFTPHTVIPIDDHNPIQIASQLYAAATNYGYWSEQVYKRFTEVVNFDAEFEQIRVFLKNLR